MKDLDFPFATQARDGTFSGTSRKIMIKHGVFGYPNVKHAPMYAYGFV